MDDHESWIGCNDAIRRHVGNGDGNGHVIDRFGYREKRGNARMNLGKGCLILSFGQKFSEARVRVGYRFRGVNLLLFFLQCGLRFDVLLRLLFGRTFSKYLFGPFLFPGFDVFLGGRNVIKKRPLPASMFRMRNFRFGFQRAIALFHVVPAVHAPFRVICRPSLIATARESRVWMQRRRDFEGTNWPR
jgi:hypothetical protein